MTNKVAEQAVFVNSKIKVKGWDDSINETLKSWDRAKKKVYIFKLSSELMKPDQLNPGRLKVFKQYNLLPKVSVRHPEHGTIPIRYTAEGDIWNAEDKQMPTISNGKERISFIDGFKVIQVGQLYDKEQFEFMCYYPGNKNSPGRDRGAPIEFELENIVIDSVPVDERNQQEAQAFMLIFPEQSITISELFDKAKNFDIDVSEFELTEEKAAYIRSKLVSIMKKNPQAFIEQWKDTDHPVKKLVNECVDLKVVGLNGAEGSTQRWWHFLGSNGRPYPDSRICGARIQPGDDTVSFFVEYLEQNQDRLEQVQKKLAEFKQRLSMQPN